ncbi:MAG: RHS repeat-associated core domain-containing protein [Planctomycetota bacterium]
MQALNNAFRSRPRFLRDDSDRRCTFGRARRRWFGVLLLSTLLCVLGGSRADAGTPQFIRGDCNADGAVQISDAVFTLAYLFVPGSDLPSCTDACDVNGDLLFNISDPIYLLNYLFVIASPPPPSPFPDCGASGAGSIDCVAYIFCVPPPPPLSIAQEPSRDDADAHAVGATEHVLLANGEVRLDRVDLFIPGRGEIHFELSRRYRSRLEFDGPLGFGWDHVYNESLVEELSGDIVRRNGRGHFDRWTKNVDGSYAAPRGHFRTLRKFPDGTFVLRSPNGFKRYFDAAGRLARHEDRNGHQMLFVQDAAGRLDFVVDAYGRVIDFNYAAAPDGLVRLQSVTDFFGREVVYSYSAQGDLIEVRSPIVVGTSIGNDFPDGRTERYAYSTGAATPALLHNLLSVTRPEEVATSGSSALSFSYETDTGALLTLDRVLAETRGGTNSSGVPAGGTTTFVYALENPGAPLGDLDLSRLKVTVTERNGNVYDVSFNELDHAILVRRYTQGLRPGEPPFFATQSTYDLDGQLVHRIYPELNEVLLTYNGSGPRAAQRNLISSRIEPGPRGGGEDIVTTYTYEPLFQLLASRTDPRGNALAFTPPLGTATAERYTMRRFFDYQESSTPIAEADAFGISLAGIARGLGDLNADGITDQLHGNAVRIVDPTVLLRTGSPQALATGSTSQVVLTEIQWNESGQVLAIIDPEGNVEAFDYYPENDPDGDGVIAFSPLLPMTTLAAGYPRSVTEDATTSYRRTATAAPAALESGFEYDPAGNVLSLLNPRGVETRFEVNALNETVVVTRGANIDAAVALGEVVTGESAFGFLSRFTRDHNGRVTLFEEENRDITTPGVGAFVEHATIYDILDNPVAASVEVDATTQATTLFRYDENELLALVQQPEGNKTARTFDERNLPFRITRGADTPQAATAQRDYDQNGNLVRVIDAADNNGDGQPEAWLKFYDGFDRLIEDRDPLGNRRLYFYDVASNRVREQDLGHPAGQPSAPAVPLAERFFRYDELERIFQLDQSLFLAAGFAPIHPVQLLDGNSDGFVSSFIDHDALSRQRFEVDDDGETVETIYDGANRPIEILDALGNRRTIGYDRSSNSVSVGGLELSPEGLVPSEEYMNFHVYDQLDRRVRSSASLSTRYNYDSRDNLIGSSDPQGAEIPDPLGFFPGVTNGPGNTRTFVYDGRGLCTRSITDLRVNGSGDQPLDLSNPFNLDGRITVDTLYDLNGRPVAMFDDNLNVTMFSYDALDRQIEMVYPDASTSMHAYDGDDNLITESDPNGTTTAHLYDAANRLVTSAITPGLGVQGTTQVSRAYDGLSRLTSATDTAPAGVHAIARIYDSLSRLLEEQQDGAPSSAVLSGDGQRLLLRYPGGRMIDRAFDALDRLTAVSDSGSAIANYAYMGPGLARPLRRVHGNGTRLTFLNNAENFIRGYDSLRRITELRHVSAAGSFVDRDYQWNRASERLEERRNDDLGLTDRYNYDSNYRLVRADLDNAGATTSVPRALEERVYQLDGAGNRRSTTEDFIAAATTTTPYSVNALNQYTAIGATARVHDLNGNVVDDGVRLFTYDAFDRLIAVRRKSDNALIATYGHDALDRRVRKVVYDPATAVVVRDKRYYYDTRWRVIEERNPAGVEATYAYGFGLDEPVQMLRSALAPEGAGTYTLHQNARGDVVAVTDATGYVVERTRFTDFGAVEPSRSIANPWLFQGRELDAETGLYHFRNRAYDPEAGRFLQRDPVYDPGNSGNLYSFVNNGPVTHLDPYGLSGGYYDLFDLKLGEDAYDTARRDYVTGRTLASNSCPGPRECLCVGPPDTDAVTNSSSMLPKQALDDGDGPLLPEWADKLIFFKPKENVIGREWGKPHRELVVFDQTTGQFIEMEKLFQDTRAVPVDWSYIQEMRGPRIRPGRSYEMPQIAVGPDDVLCNWPSEALRGIDNDSVTLSSFTLPSLRTRADMANFIVHARTDTGSQTPTVPPILYIGDDRPTWYIAREGHVYQSRSVGKYAGNRVRVLDYEPVYTRGRPLASYENPMVKITPPPPPVVANDLYTVPPSTMTSHDVSLNDFVVGGVYSIVTPPPLSSTLFQFRADGTFQISPLTSQTGLNFTYQAAQGAVVQTANVTITVNRTLLHELTPFTQFGIAFVSVPCLVLGGLHYPIYQFNLSNNPLDVCVPAHWHRPVGLVFPLEAPLVGIVDPDPPQCGFGIYAAVPQADFIVTLASWDAFKLIHAPPP